MQKRKGQPTLKETKIDSKVQSQPEELYTSSPSAIRLRESIERRKWVRSFVDIIAGKFMAALGSSADYEVVLAKPTVSDTTNRLIRGLGATPEITSSAALGSPKAVDSAVDRVVLDARSVLTRSNLSEDDVKDVVRSVCMKIVSMYEKTFKFANNRITPIKDLSRYIKRAKPDAVLQIRRELPEPVGRAVNKLETLIDEQFLMDKVENELRELTVPEAVVQIAKRSIRASPENKRVYDRICRKLLAEYERAGGDEAAIRDRRLDEKRRKEGKLGFRQIMVLLSALIPQFKDANNTKKAEFIAAISPYDSTKQIGDEFSYLRRLEREHADLVEYWKLELKSTKRGRPRSK